MLSQADNERLTRVGPGQPMGNLFRRYWIPGAAVRGAARTRRRRRCACACSARTWSRFRDTDGKVAFVDAFCPHRRAPMFFGRNEECGLRCVYHGWKFDRDGTCVDMPSEPPD